MNNKKRVDTEIVVTGDLVSSRDALAAGHIDTVAGMLAGWFVPVTQGIDIRFALGLHTGCASAFVLVDSDITELEAGQDIAVSGAIGGMRQRAAVIRSLAVAPDVLLLDEPLGALDSFTRMVLQDEIIRLWKARGNTMIMITHDVDEAVYLSNRIIVMSPRPGRIAEIVDVPMSYPRNRSTSEFAELRTRLLKRLNFASDVEQDYYL